MIASLSEGEADGLVHRFRLGSDTLVVVFSQVRVPAGKFGLERLFAGTTHSLLLFNEPANNWYRGREAAIDGVIGAAAVAAKASRLVFYGSSMGAFGAAAAAARHPEAELYAFAPDFRIGEPGSQSAAASLVARPDEAGLDGLLGSPRYGAARIVIPLYDAYDAGVGARLADRRLPDGLTLVPLRSSHEVHDHLYSLNIIRKVTATFRRDIAVEAATRGLLVQSVDWPAYARFSEARAAFDDGANLDLKALLGLMPDVNPGLVVLAAEVAERMGDIDRAATLLAELDAAIACDVVLSGLAKRYLKDIPRRRIRLLKDAGEVAASHRVAVEAAARFPTDEGFAALAAGPD
ncbi:hypothetical protein [Pleomorphomonas sp. PLEO]|uniref:hypothetical protein n=1 Tax=Pleomorphomonas sp. PLEO TaxID=3239306 RepID=UPI00351DD83C